MAASLLPRRLAQQSVRGTFVAPSSPVASTSRCIYGGIVTSRRAELHTAPTVTQEQQKEASNVEDAYSAGAASPADLWGIKTGSSTSSHSSSSNLFEETSKPSNRTASSGNAAAGRELLETASEQSLPDLTEDTEAASRPNGMPSYSFAFAPKRRIKYDHLVCQVTLSSYSADLANLTFYSQFIQHAAHAFGLPYTRPAPLPIKTSLRTVPRSPFVHKPSQENFIKKEHSRSMRIYDSDIEAVKQWLEYIQENGMSGIRLKAKLWERKQLGFGEKMLEDSAEELGAKTQDEQVKEIAEGLLKSGLGGESQKSTPAAADTKRAEQPSS